MILQSDPTLFGLRADAWAAIGVWATLVVSGIAAVLVLRQVIEARRLREDQTRPFVIVDVAFRSVLVELVVKNIGATAAKNVVVHFDTKIESKHDLGWLQSPLFATGMPLMAPGRTIRFFLDSFPARVEAGLPMVITGAVTYDSPHTARRSKPHTETFEIDLNVYRQSLLTERGIPDLVKQVEDLRKELSKWTDGARGIQVAAIDKDRQSRREVRSFRIRAALELGRSQGWRRVIVRQVAEWKNSVGWRG